MTTTKKIHSPNPPLFPGTAGSRAPGENGAGIHDAMAFLRRADMLLRSDLVPAGDHVDEDAPEAALYRKMYDTMFRAVAEANEKLQQACDILIRAQRRCELLYMDAADPQNNWPAE